MGEVALTVRESMLIVDGGEGVALPREFGSPVAAGPDAVFVRARSTGTSVRLSRLGPARPGLVKAFEGSIGAPDYVVRLVDLDGAVLAQVPVATDPSYMEIFLDDLDAPGEIVIAIDEIETAATARRSGPAAAMRDFLGSRVGPVGRLGSAVMCVGLTLLGSFGSTSLTGAVLLLGIGLATYGVVLERPRRRRGSRDATRRIA
jgi:hypothetical protein